MLGGAPPLSPRFLRRQGGDFDFQDERKKFGCRVPHFSRVLCARKPALSLSKRRDSLSPHQERWDLRCGTYSPTAPSAGAGGRAFNSLAGASSFSSSSSVSSAGGSTFFG